MAMPGDEVIPSWHRRITDRTFDSDTSVLDDVPAKTLESQLLPASTASCNPKATVGLLVTNHTMILAQVGKNILGCSIKFIIAKGSFVVPPAKEDTAMVMRVVIVVRLEANSTVVTRRKVW